MEESGTVRGVVIVKEVIGIPVTFHFLYVYFYSHQYPITEYMWISKSIVIIQPKDHHFSAEHCLRALLW